MDRKRARSIARSSDWSACDLPPFFEASLSGLTAERSAQGDPCARRRVSRRQRTVTSKEELLATGEGTVGPITRSCDAPQFLAVPF